VYFIAVGPGMCPREALLAFPLKKPGIFSIYGDYMSPFFILLLYGIREAENKKIYILYWTLPKLRYIIYTGLGFNNWHKEYKIVVKLAT
jgi:hypothetical protein